MKTSPILWLCAALLSNSALAYQNGCGNDGDNDPCADKPPCECDSNEGANPVSLYRGSLLRDVTDLKIFGPAPFEFKRTYNSRPRNYTVSGWELGTTDTWQHNWQYQIREATQTAHGFNAIIVRYPQGAEKYFYAADSTGTVFVTDANFGDRIYPSATPGQFVLRSRDGKEMSFRREGSATAYQYLLDEVRDGQGAKWTLTYTHLEGRKRLTRISNNYGRYIDISGSMRAGTGYWTINSITANDGRTVSYTYSAWAPTSKHVLSSVAYPDSTTAQYTWVGHTSLTTGDPLLATASDPTYGGAGARTSYTYHYGLTYGTTGALKGTILEEKNTDTGEATVKLPDGAGPFAKILQGGKNEIVRKFAGNNVTQIIDAMGRITNKTYQTVGGVANAGHLSSVTNPAGATTTYTRDAMGRVLTETDALGGVTTYTYNNAGFVLTTTDALGRTTTHTRDAANRITRTDFPDATYETFTYNANGLLLTKRFRNASSESFIYHLTNGNLISHTNAAGHITTHAYFSNGLRSSITTPLGHTTTFLYDWQGRLIKTTHPDGTFRTVAYDAFGNVSMEADELLNVTTYTYDAFNRRATVTDALNRVTTYSYGEYSSSCGSCSSNGSGQPISITYPDGSITRFTYDLSGKLLTTTTNHGTTYAATTTQAYDAAGRVQTVTNALGHVTTYTYDLLSRKTSTKDPLNRTTTFTYDLVGNLLTQTAPDATVTTRTYDVMDRVASVKDPLNHTTSYSYNVPGRTSTVTDALNRSTITTTDALDRAISQQDASGNTTTSTYDTAGRMTATTDALGHSTTYAYNARGHLISSTDPLGNITRFEVDALGRTTATITPAPLSLRTESTYDALGNLTATKRPDGLSVTRLYDSMDRPIKVTEPQTPQPQVTEYTYHPTGTLQTLKDPKGQVTTWTYDKLLRLTQKQYANGNTHSYTYNAASELLTHTTPNGHIATHSYNLKGQLLSQTWNTTTPATTYTYFADGQQASITHGPTIIQSTYDAAHQLLTDTQSLTGFPTLTTTASHDASGRRILSTYTAGRTVKYAWTSRNQLASVEVDGPPPFAHYSYDAAGRLTSLAHENGITETLGYDSNSRLLARTHSRNGTPVNGHSYALDTLGRRTGELRSGVTPVASSYTYDPTSQVTSANYGSGQTDSYAYDPAGNRSSATIASLGSIAQTYNTNNANQYTSITGIAAPISYDSNGNLTQQNGNTYTWDSHNRLISLVPNNPAIGGKALHHTYDGLHRRVTSQVREWTGSSWVNLDTTRFRYDGWNVVEEYSILANTQTLARTRTWGSDLSSSLQGAGGVSGLLLTEEISGSTTTAYHHHYDGNGNVTEITNLSGNKAASYRYDAFGNTLTATGPYAAQNRYRFSTKPLDSAVTNAPLYYYGYRYYDPVTGRWPSRDPIEEKGGMNLYAFVGNNGINFYDVLGLKEKKCDCDGKASTSLDCRWTGDKTGSRITGNNMKTLIPHKMDPRKYPNHARVYWDNICNNEEALTQKKLIHNPSGGTNLDIIGKNSARTSIQSRYFSAAFLMATNPVMIPQADALAAALGATAVLQSKADFCCCKSQ